MNTLINTTKTALIVAAAGLFSINATAGEQFKYSAAEEQKIVNICKAAKSDKVFKLRKATRNANLTVAEVANQVVCNGSDIIDYAAQHESYKTANYLAEEIGQVAIHDLAMNK
ncbi:DUF3718 domain-containing protein [Catenovulum sp. SM1970]|uniref:DUF3718 domain-containing protein n=1 Tax=Marinifaba aquimaris TaxID=2741323 RepID=UPI001573116D|nr:DUF3718 domain-containing protein [Marinifaba aquimaris]NTS77981.1 DUF3718 domain-containing protein [Marinifaba aquimaris]NTS77982.1 DUF3718 domain-containing protein [Marinifaba aquimaris]